MSFYRYFAVGILAALSGILGNLVAAIFQSSLGRVTPLQTVAMVLAIMVVIGINYRLEQRAQVRKRDVEALCARLAEHRLELYRIEATHSRGAKWSLEEVDRWRHHQNSVMEIKRLLRSMNVACDHDWIDEMPPPALGCLTKGLAIAMQISMLFVFPFVLALSVAYYLSPGAHTTYLAVVPNATELPNLNPTPPRVVMVVTSTAAPTSILGTTLAAMAVTETPGPGTPTLVPGTSTAEPSPQETMLSTFPTTPIIRSTPIPTRTPAGTLTATPTMALTPTSTGIPSSAGTPLTPLLPVDGAQVSGLVEFRWETSASLGDGEGFELVIWRSGEDPLQGFGLAEPTTSSSIRVDLNAIDASLGHILDPGTFQWGILKVNTQPYQRLEYLGGGWTFTFSP